MTPEVSPHAVVTGVSSGIGLAITRRLLAVGWRVTGLSRRPAVLDGSVLDGSVEGPLVGSFGQILVDLDDTSALRQTLGAVGTVDAIVHAAGFQHSARLGSLDDAHGEAMWRVHVQAACALVDELAGRIGDGGRVLLIGSRTMSGVAGKSQYAATKAALLALARSWAMELAGRRITVNVLAPGPTRTPMLADPARSATPPQLPPLGRFIEPDEIARYAEFLLAPSGAMITGQHLVMCAGASL